MERFKVAHSVRKDTSIDRYRSVHLVAKDGLCMGCGVCESVCPLQAIRVRIDNRKGVYRPIIDNDCCTNCGLCIKACPGFAVNFKQLAKKFLDTETQDNTLGNYRSCYFAHATDQDIRYHSSSGGLVSALLIYALEKGLIDAVLVTRFSDKNPLIPETVLAQTPKQIIAACGSKYCPTSIGEALSAIVKHKGGKKYAVVGLPCQIHGIRKLEQMHPELQKKIVLHFGLFCANNNTFLGTQYFLHQHGISPQEVKEIDYRGQGWPGKICVSLKDHTRKIIPRATTEKRHYRRVLFSSAFHYDFMIPRCLLCADQTCELADISFGDPWLREYTQTEQRGKSLIIVRNRIGDRLLTQAADSGSVVLEKAPLNIVKKAQNYSFKAGVGGRIRIRQILSLPIPYYGERDLVFTRQDITSCFRYLPSYFSYYRCLWPYMRFFAICFYTLKLAVSRIKSMLRHSCKFLNHKYHCNTLIPFKQKSFGRKGSCH